MWRYVNISYSKDGIYSLSKPDSKYLFMTFLPIFNTGFAIVFWLLTSPRKRTKTKRNYSKFFAINNDKTLFQRIQYFLSKGKKFAPRETHWD